MLLLLVFAACNTKNKSEKSQPIEDIEMSSMNSCDQFLNDYEKWVNEIIVIYQKVKENPMNIEYTQKLMNVTIEMEEWSKKWTNIYECAENEQYAKRMEELQKKVDKAMEE